MVGMKCLLIYDIPNDRVRTKVADFCLDYGLDRIQLSSFTGDLSRTHQEELLLKIKARIGKHEGNVQLIPICHDDWAKRLVFIQESEEKQ
jgi:CRISPR-associated protein Cas2